MVWFKLSKLILKNRFVIIILIFLSTIFFSFIATNVRVAFKQSNLLPDSDTININYNKLKEDFEINSDVITVGIKSKNLFEKKTLNALYKLDKKLNKIPYVTGVISITSIPNIVREKSDNNFYFRKILEEKIIKSDEILEFKQKIKKQRIYKDLIYNIDKDYTTILININSKTINTSNRKYLIQDIENTISENIKNYVDEYHISGLPYIRNENSLNILREMRVFPIASAIITALLIYIIFKSFRIKLVSIFTIIVSIIWSFALIVILGYEITVLSLLVPTLITIISIPNFVFLINRYYKEYALTKNKIKSISRAIEKIGNAMFFANITTALGFVALAISSTDILREFGIAASISIVFSFMLSITILPISLSLIKKPKSKYAKHLNNKVVSGLEKIVENLIVRRKSKLYIILIFSVIILLSIWGITKIKVTGNILSDVKKGTKIYKSLSFIEENIGGIIPLDIVIDTKKRNGAYKSDILSKLDIFQNYLNKIPELSKPISYLDAIKQLKQAYYFGDTSKFKVPSRHERNFIFSRLKKKSKVKELANNFITEDKKKIRITSLIKDIGSNDLKRIKKQIEDKFKEVFGSKYSITVTGASVYYSSSSIYLINSLFVSIGIAILVITVLIIFLFKSLTVSIISIIPNIVPLLITGGVMGFFNIPLKPSTLIVFSIAFGICIDDTIHFLSKYKQQFTNNRINISSNIVNALRESVLSMFYTTIILFSGFLIFVFSTYGGTVALGQLLCLTVFIALVCDIFLLPSLLIIFDKSKYKKIK